jgi:hypothetical protein
MVILIAMIIIFAAAGYLANKLYGTAGLGAAIGLFALIFIALWRLGGFS